MTPLHALHPPHCMWLKAGNTGLTVGDKMGLESGGWMNDRHIQAAQQLLKQQFPFIGGLQDPILQVARTFTVEKGEFVQILNLGSCHWLTISTVGCKPNQVKVYDSMHMPMSSSMKMTVAELLQTRCSQISVDHMNVQFQKGGSDCGLFAIATATAICHGQNPLQFEYNQAFMREHLLKALLRDESPSFISCRKDKNPQGMPKKAIY